MTKTVSPPSTLFTVIASIAMIWTKCSVLAIDDFIFKPPRQDSTRIFFAESFLSSEALERFIPSKAAKDGVDEDIAKYDGRWEVAPVQTSALRGDLSLIMKDKGEETAFRNGSKIYRNFKIKIWTEFLPQEYFWGYQSNL